MKVPETLEELMDTFIGRELVGWDAEEGTVYLDFNDGSCLVLQYDEDEQDILLSRLETEGVN
jgi:hypothetical protein